MNTSTRALDETTMTTPVKIHCPEAATTQALLQFVEDEVSELRLPGGFRECKVLVEVLPLLSEGYAQYRVEIEVDLDRSTLVSSRQSSQDFPEILRQVVRRAFGAMQRQVAPLSVGAEPPVRASPSGAAIEWELPPQAMPNRTNQATPAAHVFPWVEPEGGRPNE